MTEVWGSAPKYDLVVLSRTEYEVVLGRTDFDHLNWNPFHLQ